METTNLPFVDDLQGNIEPFNDFFNFKRSRKVNGDHYINFNIVKTSSNEIAFEILTEESIITVEENEYRIKTCENSVINETPVKVIYAHHTFFDLIDRHIYESLTNTQTLQQVASFIFKGTKYNPIVIANVPNQVFESFGDDNVISLLNKALNIYKVEFELSGNDVIFKNQIGSKVDFQFRPKYNIKSIKENIDTKGLSTYIEGFGKDGLHATYTSPLANHPKIGKRDAPPVRDERFTIYESLLSKIKSVLQDEPVISIEIDFVDLKKLGYLYDTITLGDSVFVIHESLGIDYEARIVEYVDYPYEPTKSSTVTISNPKKEMTAAVSDMQSTKNELDNLMANGIPDSMLNQAIIKASKAINDSMTELEYPESGGIIARSKVNPNHVVRMTSAGIGVSSDGGKTYKTAMTGEGLVAELIRGGLITGSTLRTDNSANYVHIQKQFIRLMESNLVRVYLGYYTNSVNQLQPTIVLGGDAGFQDGSVVLSQQPTQGFLGIINGKDINGDPDFVSSISFRKTGATTIKSKSLMSLESTAGLSATISNGAYWVEVDKGVSFNVTDPSNSFWVNAPKAVFKCQVSTDGINIAGGGPDSLGTIKYMNGSKGWGAYLHIGSSGWAFMNISI
ncbi:phage tail protein [Bacillus thuringiensis]|uniref:phage tail protein n=1 Tax=Bacillus thuringiensis TaxID=1428 RepID=UPI000BFDBF9B|nr:phage tail protein [Bacillus thuringiensis]MED4447451.1 phage tail protein [Bacillus cereus]PGU35144.1 hypothetical protein COD63_29725 [Bacillus thuringiensis]